MDMPTLLAEMTLVREVAATVEAARVVMVL
jgi:hypothetical protein